MNLFISSRESFMFPSPRSSYIAIILLSCSLLVTGCPSADSPEENMVNNTSNTNNSNVSNTGTSTSSSTSSSTSTSTSQIVLSSVSPFSGPQVGGTEVTLTGSGFEGQELTIFFGSQQASQFTIESDTSIKVTTPQSPMAGPVDIKVSTDTGQSDLLAQAFEYIGEEATTVFCQLQAQSPASVVAGVPIDPLYVLVFAQVITPGQGQGQGVEAELGWGAKDEDPATFMYSAMTYNVDKDGLTPGDLSNDEYGGQFTIPMQGEYSYAARIKVDGLATEWIYCDLDGSENGYDGGQAGVVNALEAAVPQVDFCQLQAQSPASATVGMPSGELYAVVYAPGLTEGQGQGQGMEAELGWGQDAANYESFTYSAMTYNVDKDGITPGSLSNDEYGGQFAIDMAGTYRYLARFRVNANQPWTYCDLDGAGANDPFDAQSIGEIEVTPDAPRIGFCQTETPTLTALVNEEVTVEGSLFVQGVTNMAGEPAGVDATLKYGPTGSNPSTWQEVTGVWKEDADGLVSGDQANDRYSFKITPTMVGDYSYYVSFSADNKAVSADCDTDGSDSRMGTFEPAKVGSLTVTSVNLPDSCRIQFPAVISSAAVGAPLSVYGRVFEAGVTDVTDNDPNLRATLYVGPIDADPMTERMRFTAVAATFNPMVANQMEDEFEASWTPTQTGDYRYFYTFSVDGGQSEQMCDLGGATFDKNLTGVFQVQAMAQNPPDYCRVFQGAPSGMPVTHSLADPNQPIFTAEVYELGVTDDQNNGANAAQLVAEIGYGPANVNPALPGLFTWTNLPFEKVSPGNPNNYEYQGSPYVTAPAVGDYKVVVRVKRMGEDALSWCDADNMVPELLLEQMSNLKMVP